MAYSATEHVFGVDFSAATRDAGRNVWVAELDFGDDDGDDEDGPRIVTCATASERFDCDADRDSTLRALTHHLASLDADGAAGLDFPFALPREVCAEPDWETFLRRFPGWFDDPADLQQRCQSRAELADGDRVQLTRATEDEVSGLSPYNLRLRAQTFIRDSGRPATARPRRGGAGGTDAGTGRRPADPARSIPGGDAG